MRTLRWLIASLVLFAALPAQAAFEFEDITCETSSTTGTGSLTLTGASGFYLPFATTLASGSTVPYGITASNNKVETGLGVFTAPSTLTRVADWSSDGAGAELNLPAGTHVICVNFTASTFADADKGDVVVSDGFQAWDLDELAVETELEAVLDLDSLQGNLSVSHLNSGTLASATTFWRGDGTWATPAGGVSATGTPVDNQIAVWTSASVLEGDTAFTFNTTNDALFVNGQIELSHASANTLTASGGVLSIEGVALLTATSGDALFLTPAEAGSLYQPLDTTLTAFAAYNTNGILTQTAADTFVGRTITGTANEITVTNGDGVAGNPTIDLPATIAITTAIELSHATQNTLTASAGVLSIEGVALLTSTSADALFLTPAEGNAAYQPLDADLTSWALITRAAGFDTFATTPSMANLGSLLTDDASGWTTFGTTPSSANLRSLLTDELDNGVLVFLGAPADDQVPVGVSASDTTWTSIPDSDGATQKLQYDTATNSFSAGTDDDVPDSGDYTNLTGGTGITNTAGTLSFDATEITSLTWGANNFTTMVFSTDGIDLTWDYSTTDGVPTLSGGGSSPSLALDDRGTLRLLEEDAGGSNYLEFQPPAAITTTQTCVLEDDASFIPDTCVGDGSDDDVPEVGDFAALVGGTGITNSAGTLSVDGTELGTVTWGAAATVTWTFDVGATDFVQTYTTPGTVTYSAGGTSPIVNIDDQGELRWHEEDAGGSNYVTFSAPATLASNRTCVFQDSGPPIPDSCVGDGTDNSGAGGTVSAVGTPVDNQIAVWTGSASIEGDTAFTFDTATDLLTVGGTIAAGDDVTVADDLTLSSTGAILNIGAGPDCVITHSADTLTLTGCTAVGFGAGGGAPADAEYFVGTANGTLSAERVGTDTTTIDVDIGTAAQAKWNVQADSISATHIDETGNYDWSGIHTFDSDAVQIDDTNASHQLIITPGSDLSADRVLTITTGDAARTLTLSANATLADTDYGDITTSSSFTAWAIDADSVALTTDTTGVYVAQVADGTGVDGTANAEGATYTPTLDLTEISTFTLGTGAATGIIFDAGATDPAIEVGSGTFTIDIGGANETTLTASAFSPGVDDGNTLGTTALGWQGLFFDTGATINIENGDWLATHTTGILTVGTGDLRVTTAGTNTASVVTVGGTQTLTSKTLTSPTINGATIDSTSTLAIGATTETNIEAALDTLANVTSIGGDVTAGGDFTSTDDTFVGDDLSLTSTGALINIGAANDCVITHSADTLTLTGCVAVGFGEPTNYVATVADGTGIDGTATGAASTYTPTLDLTEITPTVTWGAGSFTTMTFDAGASDTAFEFATGTMTVDIGGTDETTLTSTAFSPGVNDGSALGTASLRWADLFFATGGTIEWDGGTTNTMTCTGGNCTIEGNTMYRAGGTDVAVADGGTGASSLSDLIALTTHTTGNYAAGDAEAGAALTGDSATSFFSTGTIEAARLPAATTSAQGACEFATAAEFQTGTDTARCLVVSEVWSSGAETALSSSASATAVNMASGYNYSLSLSENTTISNPSNEKAGQCGYFAIAASGGTRTVNKGSEYKSLNISWPISIASGQTAYIFYCARSSTITVITGVLNNPA